VDRMTEHNETPPPESGNDASSDRKEPKVIKRYTNRKLYDTVESRYVTLDEIAQMIKAGAEVKIIDNRSKEDLTSVTLAQIIFEEEKKRSQMPLSVLREIIRHGGEAVAGFYQEKAGGIAGKVVQSLTEVKTRAESIREDVSEKVRTRAESIREDVSEKVRGVTSVFRKPDEPLKEAMAAGERAVGELRGKVDATVKQALDAIGAPQAAEIERLQQRIVELEKKIEQLTRA
jgi:polyhydroxyalkanoate synthesis repressor PhaR